MKARFRPGLAMLVLMMAGTGCMSLTPMQRAAAVQYAAQSRSTAIECSPDAVDACTRPSPLRELGEQAVRPPGDATPGHSVLLLDYGQDALLARLDLIAGARQSIELQTFIFDEDDAGHLILDALLGAARRGVHVRVLIDQFSALRRVDTLAALATAHVNFELRIYNPTFGRGRIGYPHYVLAAACCWRQLNQRMHNKLLAIDGITGIVGGRNYQDKYFDWDDSFNFRDRDLLVAGPVVARMQANFDQFWQAPRSVPAEQLRDVARYLLREGAPQMRHAPFDDPARVEQMLAASSDTQLVRQRLLGEVIQVGEVEFIADTPAKHSRRRQDAVSATGRLHELVTSAQDEILLQTPYLVLSPVAQDMFRELQARARPPKVLVSSNSLASTDSFITYAMSYKYKRRYLREFGFNIYEYKPFPLDAPFDLWATGVLGEEWDRYRDESADAGRSGQVPVSDTGVPERPRGIVPLQREYAALRFAGIGGVNQPVPLRQAGVRMGLHPKSMVIDERVGTVGTHNFDPRGDNINTESAVIIEHEGFARALADSIRRDMSPDNAWVIAPRDIGGSGGLHYSLAKTSELLPIFDLLPIRYATSYQFNYDDDCPFDLMAPRHPAFANCHLPVGDFPEVNLGLKSLMTRLTTAFGSGLAPIL